MSLRKFNRLSFKLPAFVAIVIMLVTAGLSAVTYFSGRATTIAQAEMKLELLVANRTDSLEKWSNSVMKTIQGLSANPSTAAAMSEFATNFNRLNAEGRAGIRADYTSLNPFEGAERENLLRADGPNFYHVAHERHHEYLRFFKETNRLYDLFLVNLEGDIIYSVGKNDDFGLNVLSGDLAQSGIGDAYRTVRADPALEPHLSSFATYAPGGGTIAAFAADHVNDADGNLIGVLILKVNTGLLGEILNNEIGLGETTETFIVNQAGQSLVDGRYEDSPSAFAQIEITDHIAAALSGTAVEAAGVRGLNHSSVSAHAVPIALDGTQYALVAEQSSREILAALKAQRMQLAILSILAAIVLSTLAWLYIRTITRSLDALRGEMSEIADGDFDVDISSTHRGDEIGTIGRTLVDFRTKLHIADEQAKAREHDQIEQTKVLETLRKGLIDLAEGDLTRPINEEFGAQYESLRKDFNETLRTLSEAISNVIQSTASIKHGANEISQASDDLSSRTETQAATLEETAAALDELTASVKSAAEGAKSVEAIVIEAQSEAEESGKIVGDAIAAMTEIEKSSEHISQILGVIDDIAFQTNLLALNAGVEAARAGDAGRGFAVVASEVRALAQRSSEAAKEIKTLISGSAKQVERGVDLVGGAGTALGNIVSRVAQISELMRNIASGSSDQASGLGEINMGVNQLDQVTQQNAAMVEQATAASHILKNDAERLQDLVSRFKTEPAANGAPRTQGRANVVEPVKFQRAMDADMQPVPVRMKIDTTSSNRATGTDGDTKWIDF